MPTFILRPETARFAQVAYQWMKKETRATHVWAGILMVAFVTTVATVWYAERTWDEFISGLTFPTMIACLGIFAYQGVLALNNIWVQLVYLNERNDWVDENRGEGTPGLEDDGD